MTEKEEDDWFNFKVLLERFILKEIKGEWKAGNIPNTEQKIFEMGNIVMEMIRESFWYLKERGEIYILRNIENDDDMILELKMMERLGVRFDQEQEE